MCKTEYILSGLRLVKRSLFLVKILWIHTCLLIKMGHFQVVLKVAEQINLISSYFDTQ